MADVRKCLNIVDQQYEDNTTAYERVILPIGQDGEALIKHLHSYEQQREADRAGAPTTALRAVWPDLPLDVQQALRGFHGQQKAGSETAGAST